MNSRDAIQCLLTPHALRAAFKDRCRSARTIHIAVAWARPGWAADCLKASDARIQSIIGTSFGATHPDTLQSFLNHEGVTSPRGSTWIAKPTASGIFHPKLYVFSTGRTHCAIVGSVNLTMAAFTANSESAVLVDLTERQYDFMIDQWEQWTRRKGTARLTNAELRTYREHEWVERRGARCPQSLKEAIDAEDLSNVSSTSVTRITRPGLLTSSWATYLSQLNAAMTRRSTGESLEDYLAVIRDVRPLLLDDNGTSRKWTDATVLGRKPSKGAPEYGHFGRLTANGRSRIIITDQRFQSGIRSRLRRVADSESNSATMATAQDLWNYMTRRPHIKHAAVTRLLTIVRPDAFLSVNGESLPQLARLLGVSQESLRSWDGYSSAVRELWSADWYGSPKPRSKLEREIWHARIGLLDAILF